MVHHCENTKMTGGTQSCWPILGTSKKVGSGAESGDYWVNRNVHP